MHSLIFATSKGGQGCSTVAAAVALLGARDRKVLLVDWNGLDLCAVLGISAPADDMWPTDVTNNVQYVTAEWFIENDELADVWDLVIHDFGFVDAHDDISGMDLVGEWIWVSRNCYLALAKASVLDAKPTGFVCVSEPGRALTERDMSRVLSTDCLASIPYDPAVARAIDAGLLAARPPKSLLPLAALVPALEVQS